MSVEGARGPIVIDTDGRPAFISFQTAAELRYGAIRRNWGPARMLALDRGSARRRPSTGPELVLVYARLRAACERIGHALGQRDHDADRWVAATALRLQIPLVSNDRIFREVPGLTLESVAGS